MRGADPDAFISYLRSVLGHERRQLLWIEVTRHPTAEWLARRHRRVSLDVKRANLFRENDRAYGHFVQGPRA